MNHEEEKKKELEKRGEDRPEQERKFPDSSMTKDQRKDAERVKDELADDDLASSTEDLNATRSTGSTPDDQAGIADIDRGLDRAKQV
jgi:hypothetical protein